MFPGKVHNRINTEHSLAGEQVESKHIIKVAHEVQCSVMIYINKGKFIQYNILFFVIFL